MADSLVKEVLGKLGSALWDEIGLLRSFKDDADDLRSNFSAIQKVLLDAEERSSVENKESHALCDWLGKLKDAAYDADDLLDVIRTEAVLQQQHKLQNQNQPAEKVRGFLSHANPMHLKFKLKMAHRMKELRKKIDKIAKQRNDFGLGEAGPRPQTEFKRPETFSVVDEKKIVGRDDDKEKIVKLLLETGGDHDVSVIPIVGLGGLGKTTLTKLAFNDRRVTGEPYFDLRVWVYVSSNFNMKKIAKVVIGEAGEECNDFYNADAVARCLVSIFSHKRFLLVLDDVCNEEQDKWEELKALFKGGKKGSKILVTTRSEKVATIMKTVEQPHRVKGLSDDDKENIVKLLLETGGSHNVSVIPIMGLGGSGKTTLARLAFMDRRVTGGQHFDLRVWVCASTNFNMKKIAKVVIDEAGEKCNDFDNTDAVARCLVRIFSQKKFLLVLDDVWNEEQVEWEELKVLFKDGMKGSKILVTTRSGRVAEIMKTTEQPHHLKGLSDDDCWTLFKRRAFKEGEENDYPSLVKIGKQIVMKCGGLPLAVNALGSMMSFKNKTEDAWLAIRNNEIWTLKEEQTILPSLKLSYIQMPSALKQCFTYCTIFPKDYKIDKDNLIRHWIALGFISSHETSSSMEDIGNEYFKDLLWMSFLQDVEETYRGVTCRMHDLVHDLAQSVASEEVAAIVGEDSTSIPKGCRYASIYGHSMPQVSNTEMRRLRALQFGEFASLVTFYGEAKCLRLLDLQDSKISVLPSSIGELKLLRYLNLSSTNIKELPESITGLCNLQALNLSFCQEIHTLPKFLGRLANLCILNLSNCSRLLSLPSSSSDLQHLEKLDISHCRQLCELQKLPIFVIGKRDRVEHCAGISELEHLKLVGELEIKGLENVTNPVDAKAANLIEKNLRSLKLKWNVLSAAEDMDTVQSAEEIDTVLENLQPHQNLAKLVIEGYAGGKFPSWMMNSIDSYLPKLVEIELVNIPRCSSLPPLGLLPVLEKLIIGDMPAITNLGVEFYGDSHINESANNFPALRRLDLPDMPVLREWGTQRRNKFPALVELSLKRMPVLREWVTVYDEEGRRERVPIFPCLTKLTLENCPQLGASVESLRSLTALESQAGELEHRWVQQSPVLACPQDDHTNKIIY